MTLQSSGPISIQDLQTEFGRTAGSLDSYYGEDIGVPASLPDTVALSLQDFYGKSAGPIVFSYEGVFSSTTNANTYTFSSTPIGAAASDRLVIVGVSLVGGTGTISSVRLGGVEMTEVGTTFGGEMGIYRRNLGTGTTTTIIVEHSGAPTSCVIGVWQVTGLSSFTHRDFYTGSPVAGGVQIVSPVPILPKRSFGVCIQQVRGTAEDPNLLDDFVVNTNTTIESVRHKFSRHAPNANKEEYQIVFTGTTNDSVNSIAAFWR
jgi:hypothetical protein